MGDVITTPWVIWKIQYFPEFKTEKMLNIKSLMNLENILNGNNYDLSTDYFAVFRNGISPDIYDVSSNYAFKHKLNDETHGEIFRTLWTLELFKQSFLNGIHFKPNEISLWTNLQKNNEGSGQSPDFAFDRLNFFLDATGIFWEESTVISDSLKCPWTIGFSEKFKFELTSFKDNVESDENLAFLLQSRYKLSAEEKCIILKSDLLNPTEWKIPYLNNRLVFCAIQTDLKTANKICMKFILNLTVSIFPQIRIINAGFCYFCDGYLKLGIYLTGKDSVLFSNLRRFRAGPEDIAFTLAHKLKQIILSELSAEDDVKVLIRNSIPPKDFDFTNPEYQFEYINGRNTLHYFSNYAFKHKLNGETHGEIFRTLWTLELFKQSFLNGIHFKPNEVSLWTNLQKNSEGSGQSSAFERLNFFLDATGIFWEDSTVISDSLKYPWTIGFSEKSKFELTSFKDNVESDENLASLLQSRYKLSAEEKCIILKSDLLNPTEWKIPYLNNRLVFCAIQTDLKTANKICMKFMLNLTVSIFPQIRIIYAAFSYFCDGYLKVRTLVLKKCCEIILFFFFSFH
uniref:Uncharacterized protein n=1 Tax=Panagrolaimus sp. PS1159 TaxID=55785 RepID=A0AC35GWI0_9BILA